MEEKRCCCKSGNTEDACCGPYLSGQAIPQTPEQLMRSRYAAFVHRDIDYLIATRDPEYCQVNDRQVLAHTCKNTQWLGLAMMKTDYSQLDRGVGFVEFVAFYAQKDQMQEGQVHENSRFVREEGRWYYSDGQMLPPVVWGRNRPCWCGSQKKYKKCHGGR